MSHRPAETMLPPSQGARNEASVLFRVDQLGGAPLSARGQNTVDASARLASVAPASSKAEPSAPVLTSIPADDEGIIDLKSLSSAPAGLGAGPLGRRAPAIVAPLFSEPPPMTLEVDETRARVAGRGRGKLVALIGAAVAVVLVLGLGLALVFRGEERRPVAAAPAPAPPPPPAAVTAPVASAQPAAVAASEGGPAEETPRKGKKRKAVRAGGSASGVKTTTKMPKAADPCGCHGELSCILGCSAKGKM